MKKFLILEFVSSHAQHTAFGQICQRDPDDRSKVHKMARGSLQITVWLLPSSAYFRLKDLGLELNLGLIR